MAVVVFQIVVGQEHLTDSQSRRAEEFFVNGHQPGLADRRARLQVRQIRRPFVVAEYAHPRPNCAGRDKDNLFSFLSHCGDLGDQLAELIEIRLFAAVGQDTGAELDDDSGDAF